MSKATEVGENELLIYVRNKETGRLLSPGTIIPLNKLDEIPYTFASQLIADTTAASMKEDNAMVVTAKLKNGETWSELYSTHEAQDFNPDLAIDSFRMKLHDKVWKLLNSILGFAKQDLNLSTKKETFN